MDLRIFRPLVPSDDLYNLIDCRDEPTVHFCYKLMENDNMYLIS